MNPFNHAWNVGKYRVQTQDKGFRVSDLGQRMMGRPEVKPGNVNPKRVEQGILALSAGRVQRVCSFAEDVHQARGIDRAAYRPTERTFVRAGMSHDQRTGPVVLQEKNGHGTDSVVMTRWVSLSESISTGAVICHIISGPLMTTTRNVRR